VTGLLPTLQKAHELLPPVERHYTHGISIATANKRTKELGARKSTGCKRDRYCGHAQQGFPQPGTYWLCDSMNQWLENFPVASILASADFYSPGFSAILIALATATWQSINAAMAKPVDCLEMNNSLLVLKGS
jgi:hypothetical protein